jgi:hypothetical protein
MIEALQKQLNHLVIRERHNTCPKGNARANPATENLTLTMLCSTTFDKELLRPHSHQSAAAKSLCF